MRLALHQQSSFNWMQVALSAAAAPVAQAVGNAVGSALSDAGASQFKSVCINLFQRAASRSGARGALGTSLLQDILQKTVPPMRV